LKFKHLPKNHKKALIQYFVIETGAWEGLEHLIYRISGDVSEDEWEELIYESDLVFGCLDFRIKTMSREEASSFIWENTPDLREDFSCFKEYHKDYLKSEVPVYRESYWPILAMPSCGEALIDGWHRLHSYLKNGVEDVSLVFV
jgi:hypothetical protein